MATSKEESTLEKVERELQAYIDKKSKFEIDKQSELNDLSKEWAIRKSEIDKKYDTAELTEDIKRHTYFLKLLKGEIAIPDDLNAKKNKSKTSTTAKAPKAPAKFTIPRTYDEAKSDNQKIYFAISELGSGTIPEILVKANSYGASFDTKQTSNAVNNLKNKFQVVIKDGKVGKALKYKVA